MGVKLIINADDYGMAKGINDAIAYLANLGTVSSTSVMANMPYAEEIKDLLANNNRIGVGVHINITQGKPLLPIDAIKTLIDKNGNFLNYNKLIAKAYLKKLSINECKKEIAAQIEFAKSLCGDRLDHWDSHQGIHKHLPFINIFLNSTRITSLHRMRCHRHFYYNNGQFQRNSNNCTNKQKYYKLIRRKMAEIYYDYLKKYTSKTNLSPDGILEIGLSNLEYFYRSCRYYKNNITLEIPCHPSTNTEELTHTTITEARINEYKCLSEIKYIKEFDGKHIQMINFGHI